VVDSLLRWTGALARPLLSIERAPVGTPGRSPAPGTAGQ